MAIELVFETHSTTVDNEQGRATGWRPGQLSEQGRTQAHQLRRPERATGSPRCSPPTWPAGRDRAWSHTAEPTFRCCETGRCASAARAAQRDARGRTPPGRASAWTGPTRTEEAGGRAAARVGGFLGDLSLRWNERRGSWSSGTVASRWGLGGFIGGGPVLELVAHDFWPGRPAGVSVNWSRGSAAGAPTCRHTSDGESSQRRGRRGIPASWSRGRASGHRRPYACARSTPCSSPRSPGR